MKIKKGDTILVISGKDRTKTGKVLKVLPKQDSLLVEGINFKKKGEHFDYFKNFFMDVYYNQSQENVKNNVKLFLTQLFNPKTPFSKSDLDMISVIYKNLDKNMTI